MAELKIAASSVPHAEILEMVKEEMMKEGILLKIVVMDDYQLPNRLLTEKQVDANFFQHEPFLQKEINDFGYPLEALAKVHIEPLGIYSQKHHNLDQLPKKLTITIPSDPTNESRALRLLERAKIIRLSEKADQYATILDIIENPYGAKIEEVDAPLLTRILREVDLAVIPGNFALQAALNYEDALILEEKDSPYINILVVRASDKEREELKLLASILTGEKIRNLIHKKYRGRIVCASSLNEEKNNF